MPSTKPLIFDRKKFDKYIKGDLGIADKIHKEDVVSQASLAATAKDKAVYQELIEPNKKTSLWATEKSFISTSFEIQKPFIELTKHTLEILGHLEYINICISGGPNPFNIPESYAQAFKDNIQDMSIFKTGFEPAALSNAGQVQQQAPPTLPENIYLGRFNAAGEVMNPEENEQGLFTLETGNRIWPQYQTFSQFTDEQTDKINNDTADVEQPYRQQILDARPQSFQDEWDDMDSKNQLKTNFDYLLPNLKKYYIPTSTSYLDNQVSIDIEEDYDIKVRTDVDSDQNPSYVITATLKSSVRENMLNAGSNGNVSPTLPDPLPPQSYSRAIKFFFSKTLKVILTKYLPVLIKAKQLMAQPEKFIGDNLISFMHKNFEVFDPKLKNDPKIKEKYYSKDKLLINGYSNMNVDTWKVNLQIQGTDLKIKTGKHPTDVEQPIGIILLNLMALTCNFMNQILDIFSGFLSSIFKVSEIPIFLPEFLSYQSFRNILIPINLYKMIGCQGLDLLTMPMYIKSSNATDKTERSFKRMAILFMNSFVEIAETIMNQKLAAPLIVIS